MKPTLNNLILKQLSEIKPENNSDYIPLDDFSLTRLFIACVLDFTAYDKRENKFYFRQNGIWYPDKSDVKIQNTALTFIIELNNYAKSISEHPSFKEDVSRIATYQKMRRIINLCRHEEKLF